MRTAALRPYLRLFLPGAFLLILGVALVARLTFAAAARHPGRADEAFYYTVALNLVNGRGFEIDYIWHYLAPPAAVTHFSNDYWLPLTSIFISGSLYVLGPSLFAALLPPILAALVLSVLTYCWSRASSSSRLAAFSAAAFILFEPNLFSFSLTTATPIPFALLASTTLYLLTLGAARPRLLPWASLPAALGHLTRHDGALLLVAVLAAISLSGTPRKTRLGYAGLALTIYGLVLSPWLVRSYTSMGALFPPGTMKLLLLRTYEDRYSYAKDLSLSAYLEWGLSNIFLSKMHAAIRNLEILASFLPALLWIFASVGIIAALIRRERRPLLRAYAPALFFGAALYVFHSFIADPIIAFRNSGMAVIPFLAIAGFDAMAREIRSAVVVVLVSTLITWQAYSASLMAAGTLIGINNELSRQLDAIKVLVDLDRASAPRQPVVIMTRIPWELAYSTGYRAIQIPNDDLPTILAVARRYGANHLLLPAPRGALYGLYHGTVSDPRFQLVATLPYAVPPGIPFVPAGSQFKLFRMMPDGPERGARER